MRIHRVVWCGAAEPILSRYGMDRRLLEMAGQLLGSSEMNQLINQAHFKLPGDGVEFPWHQDSTHRRFGGDGWQDLNGRGSYVQTVTAIDTVTHDNGPLEFIPGSWQARSRSAGAGRTAALERRCTHRRPGDDGSRQRAHVRPLHFSWQPAESFRGAKTDFHQRFCLPRRQHASLSRQRSGPTGWDFPRDGCFRRHT